MTKRAEVSHSYAEDANGSGTNSQYRSRLSIRSPVQHSTGAGNHDRSQVLIRCRGLHQSNIVQDIIICFPKIRGWQIDWNIDPIRSHPIRSHPHANFQQFGQLNTYVQDKASFDFMSSKFMLKMNQTRNIRNRGRVCS